MFELNNPPFRQAVLTTFVLLCSGNLVAAVSPHYTEAHERFQKKEYLLAMLAAQKAVHEDGSNPVYLHLYGVILTELKQFTDAETNLRKAVSQDPTQANYYFALGVVLHHQRIQEHGNTSAFQEGMSEEKTKSLRDKETVECFERAVELQPDHLEARLRLGRIYQGKKMIELAYQQFSEIEKRDPGFPSVHYHLSAIYLNEGKLDVALRELKTEVKQHPEDASARLELADLLLHTGFPNEALQHLVSAEQIDSKVPDVYFAMAKAHRDLGQLEKAVESARKCIALSAQLPASHYLLGEIYAKKGDTRMARAEMEIFEKLKKGLAEQLTDAYRSLNRE
jgi:tetratricopeptide (TPR) repeat protein